MAENSDGSIILSVKIDDSGIKPQLNKLKSEIEDIAKRTDKVASDFSKVNARLAKAEILNEKLKQAQEKTAQSVEKTYQYIEKTNQEKLKTSQLDDKAILSAEKVAQAELKTAQQREKLNAEKAKAAQQSAKQAQEEAKVNTEVFKSNIAREKNAQEILKTLQNVEKTSQFQQKSTQETEKTSQFQQKSTQETEKTKQAQEKTKQAVEKTKQAQNKTTEAINKSKKATDTWKSATENITSALGKMARNLGIVFGIRELLRFSNEASKIASQTEAYLKRLGMLYGEAAQEVYDFADANAYAFGMSKTAAYEAAADYGNIFTTFADGAESAKLTNEMLQATAVIASQTGRTYADVFEKIRSGLYGNTRAIDDLGLSVRQSSLKQTEAYKIVTQGVKEWNDLTDAELQQVRALAIVEQAQQHYGNTVLQSTALVRSQFNAAWEDFKSSWGQIVNLILVPTLEVATKILNVFTYIMQQISQIAGYNNSISNSIGESANNQKELTQNIKETNKELKKTLAGFDDLQILSSKAMENNEDNSELGSLALLGTTNTQKISYEKEDYGYIKDTLADLSKSVGEGLLAVGVIALFTGNIPLGLGLILAGSTGIKLGEALSEDNPAEKVKSDINNLKEFILEHLFEIGVIVLFTGNIPLGMGIIIGSAIYEATKEEEFDEKSIKDKINIIMEYVSTALIAIGLILVIFGQFAIGIGFIIAGKELLGVTEEKLEEGGIKTKIQKFFEENQDLIVGVGLALVVIALIIFAIGGPSTFPIALGLLLAGGTALATAEAMKEGAIKESIKKFFEENAGLVVGISLAMLVLGIILCFSGVGLGLGIALIVVGVVGLVSEVVLHWDFIKEKVSKAFDAVKKWVSTWGLLVLGILLCITGIGIPLGIALIKKGAENLTEAQDPLWMTIVDKVKEIWQKVKDYWNKHIAQYFTAKWWGELAKNASNGFIEWVLSGLNSLIRKVNEFGFDLPDVLGGGRIGFDIPEIKIPKLARGAVLPGNNPFLAVVNDQTDGVNIEAPAKLIKQMAMEAIQEMGGLGANNQVIKEEHYYLNQTELMSVLYKLVKGGKRLKGNSIIDGGNAI